MIPENAMLNMQITEPVYANRTYKIVFSNGESNGAGLLSLTMSSDGEAHDRISGFTDGLDAVIQAAYLILSTERYQFNIYSWDYGVELLDLFGKPLPYVMADLPRRITEALIQDNRITSVTDFEFERNGSVLHTTFTIVTDLGNISTEMEVGI